MKRFIPFLLLSFCLGSGALITGCTNQSSNTEGSFTNADNSKSGETIKELVSSTDIGDVYNGGGINLGDSLHLPTPALTPRINLIIIL